MKKSLLIGIHLFVLICCMCWSDGFSVLDSRENNDKNKNIGNAQSLSNAELVKLARTRKLKLRKDITTLTNNEKIELARGFNLLKASGEYDKLVMAHYLFAAIPNSPRVYQDFDVWRYIHKSPSFFPWHRGFILELELRISVALGNEDFRLPYWNWVETRKKIDRGEIPIDAPEWTDFMGGNGDPNVCALKNPNPDLGLYCSCVGQVTNGPFANWPISVQYGNGRNCQFLTRNIGGNNYNPKCNQTPENNKPSGQAQYDYALSQPYYDTDSWSPIVTSGFRNIFEGWIASNLGNASVPVESGVILHNQAHVYMGGSMLPVTSPNDPIFFVHHSYVDRAWEDWSLRHPNAAKYLPNVTNTVDIPPLSGIDTPMYGGLDLTPRELLDTKALGYYYTDLNDKKCPPYHKPTEKEIKEIEIQRKKYDDAEKEKNKS